MAVIKQTTLDQIAAIEKEAAEKIDALRQSAVSELAKRLAEAKAVVKSLEAEYESITGKTIHGNKAGGTRRRLNKDEQAALEMNLRAILKSKSNGLKMSDLSKATGESVSAVKRALSRIPYKTTGSKATTLYFSK